MSGQLNGGIFRPAVKHQHLTDVLHRSGAQRLAQALQPSLALDLVGACDLYLDELVHHQRALNLFDYSRTQAFVADDDHGMARMGEPLEILALGRGKLHVEGRFRERAILADFADRA